MKATAAPASSSPTVTMGLVSETREARVTLAATSSVVRPAVSTRPAARSEMLPSGETSTVSFNSGVSRNCTFTRSPEPKR